MTKVNGHITASGGVGGSGSTIVVDKKAELTGEEGESLVDIRIVEGEPRAEKVTVPADDEPAEPEEAPAEAAAPAQ